MSQSQVLSTRPSMVGPYVPRNPSPLGADHDMADARGIDIPQRLMIEAPAAPLPVSLREEIVPTPDALWQRLSGQEKYPRHVEGQNVTWAEFLETMRQFLAQMVNSEFKAMYDTFSRVEEQLSVQNYFYNLAAQ